MPAEYHINERDDLITLRLRGAVDATEARACAEALLADPAFSPQLPQLIDLREAEPNGAAGEATSFEEYLLDHYRPRIEASVAVVINREWDYDMCAWVYWLCCALQHAELFDDWNQACKWLIKKEFSKSKSIASCLQDMSDESSTSSTS
jgi:hypothetical protein